MILHLCEDEKFIDHVISIFESVAPGKSIYYIEPSDDEEEKLKLVNSNHPNIVCKPTISNEYKKLIATINEFDAVIFHNLFDSYKQTILQNTSKSTRFHWMCWGADLYFLPELSKNLYLKKTKKLSRKNYNINGKIGSLLSEYTNGFYNLAFKIIHQQENPDKIRRDQLKKIDSVSTVIPFDYYLIQKHISRKIEFKTFKYVTIEDVLGDEIATLCTDENFLVGNSATLTNNHLDTFDFLSNINIENRKVIVPLSYGPKEYAEYIKSIGEEMFKESFMPLMEFLPLSEYHAILSSCGNVVMNQIRQQALANIIVALWRGARVFLNKKSPVFSFFKDRDFIIFEIEDLKRHPNLPSFKELAAVNRPLLNKIYSRKQVQNETIELVDYLTSK